MAGLAILKRLIGLIAAALLAALSYWSLRLAYADHLFHRHEIERAASLAPGNAEYQRRLGNFEAAVKLNPRDSSAWIRIGLNAEMQGDFVKAERALLQAASVDKTFEPRWTLANYYFRRDDRPKFWFWIRKAAEMNYDDASVMFRLCWRITENPNEILERAIPDQPVVLRQYLGYLLREKQLSAAASAADRLVAHSGPDDVPMLVACCDRLLESRDVPAAVRLWNDLSSRKLIAAPSVRPETITNGNFATPLVQHGFDWYLNPVEGVSVRLDAPAGLRIAFSGKQPERFELLRQYVPVKPGRAYVFRFHYRTQGIAPGAGLRWRVYAPDLIAVARDLSDRTLTFTTPASSGLIRLALTYERLPGTTRIEGELWLYDVELCPFASLSPS